MVTDTEGTGMDAPVEASKLLNAQTVRDQSAGQNVLTHLLNVGNDRHHLQRHLQDLDAAFIRLLAHEQDALRLQLQSALGPEGKRFLRSVLSECAGGLLCELLKAILL